MDSFLEAVTLRLTAHRVYDGGRGSDRPRTLIFRVLRWHDRSDILKGARQAIRWSAHRTMSHCYFFLTLVRLQIRRKAFGPVLKKMTAWSPALPHLSAVIKLRHKGEQKASIPQKAEDFISSMSQQKYAALWGGTQQRPLFLGGGRGVAGMDGPSCPEGMMAGWTWTC